MCRLGHLAIDFCVKWQKFRSRFIRVMTHQMDKYGQKSVKNTVDWEEEIRYRIDVMYPDTDKLVFRNE